MIVPQIGATSPSYLCIPEGKLLRLIARHWDRHRTPRGQVARQREVLLTSCCTEHLVAGLDIEDMCPIVAKGVATSPIELGEGAGRPRERIGE